jgi:type VII secretion integral membrane protein EccD
VKHDSQFVRMDSMSENAPEPALNGHGSFVPDSSWSEAASATADRPVADTAKAGDEQARPAAVDDLCRLAVCGPARTVELAVPIHVPLIDLLPALIGHLGDGLADAGLEHGGWVLQRLGDPPLREELSVAALGLRDGDVVHLRPRAEQLPPLDFDDLIDGVATTISTRPDRWRPDMSRRLLVGLLAVPLAAGLGVLARHLGTVSELAAGGLALLLIGLTAAASRALADLPAAGVLGAAAIGYAGLAAAELPLLYGEAAVRPLGWVTIRAAMLAVGAAVAGAAMAVAMARGGRHPALVATAVAGMFTAVGGALATVASLEIAATAGILLALIAPFGGWTPMIAFRLASMRLDPTPSTPDELQSDLDPVPGQHVVDSTRLADRYMTALYCGLAVVVTGCLVVLGVTAGLRARLVAIDVIALLLLHSRVLVAARHRLAVLVPAVCGAAVLVTAAGLRADSRSWPAVLAGLVVAAALLLVGERLLPEHKLLPHWGRAGDLLHTLTAVALIPGVLWLLNLYEFARSAHR